MKGSIEIYVRNRRSADDDKRSGSLTTGPALVRLVRVLENGERQEDEAFLVEDVSLLIEVDELTPADDLPASDPVNERDASGRFVLPPSRALKNVTAVGA